MIIFAAAGHHDSPEFAVETYVSLAETRQSIDAARRERDEARRMHAEAAKEAEVLREKLANHSDASNVSAIIRQRDKAQEQVQEALDRLHKEESEHEKTRDICRTAQADLRIARAACAEKDIKITNLRELLRSINPG